METLDTINFLKIRNVKSPIRSYKYDAGIDFFIPEFNKEFIIDLKEKNSELFNGNKNLYADHGIIYNPTNIATSGVGSLSIVGSEGFINWDLSDNNTQFKFDESKGENYFILPPHARIMIPSGIKSRMCKPGRALIANNKSGIATKLGLIFGAAVIDYTYKGEIHLSIINTSTKNVRLYENMKILQFIETPVFFSKIEIKKVTSTYRSLEFFTDLEDDRGEAGFGSTDKK